MTDPTADLDPSVAVVLERHLETPIDQVWSMWTDPERFASWYGPMGASIPVAELDVVVGGHRRVCMTMQTPNGAMTMWFVGEYLEVEPPHRLVYTEAMANEAGEAISPAELGMPGGGPTHTRVELDLSEVDGRTRLILRHIGVPAGTPGEMGWTMALDKLGNALAG